MMIFEDVTAKELFEFEGGISLEELRYYDDFQAVFILEHGVYVKGIRADGQLAGIGGIYKTYGLHSTFHMVKKEFQGRGIGNFITKNNLDYAKSHNIPLLFYICSKDNVAIIKSVKKYGDKEVFSYKDKRYSYVPVTSKGKIMGFVLPLVVKTYVWIKNRRKS